MYRTESTLGGLTKAQTLSEITRVAGVVEEPVCEAVSMSSAASVERKRVPNRLVAPSASTAGVLSDAIVLAKS